MLQQHEVFGPRGESRVYCLKLGARGEIDSELLTLTGQTASKKNGNANPAIATHAKGTQTQPPMNRNCMCKYRWQHWRTSSWSLEKAKSDPFELLSCTFRHWELKKCCYCMLLPTQCPRERYS